MACTTLLVGKKASYDGSTIIARNDDGHYDIKKLVSVDPKTIPTKYTSVISHVEIELPKNGYRYSAVPNVDKSAGIWAACGINEKNVGMTATETITTNPRVLGADPYVKYNKETNTAGGIGEEDFVCLVLPFINSAKEGILRLGALLEKYGTYESNGIAFSDENEIWWLETIGGHHFIARRVKDTEYVIMPNQFGMDEFDFNDALGKGENYLCSSDLLDFVKNNHLDLNNNGKFNPRLVFGSHTHHDHIYNTPRAWFMARYFNPRTYKWDGDNADFTPASDDIPWSLTPERKITIEDVKAILSSTYEDTNYNPYSKRSTMAGVYRPIGINRTDVLGILQIRGYMEDKLKAVEWLAFGPNPFNTLVPLFTNVENFPKALTDTTLTVDTDNFIWQSRLIAALTDASYDKSIIHVERYQNNAQAKAHELLMKANKNNLEEINEEVVSEIMKLSKDTLAKVLYETTMNMKCGYNRGDN